MQNTKMDGNTQIENTCTQNPFRWFPQADLWSNKSSSLQDTRTHMHARTHTHTYTYATQPCQVQSFAYPVPSSTLWRQMFSVILHLVQLHTCTCTHTHTQYWDRHVCLVGTTGSFLVQECTTDPDCWLHGSHLESKKMGRGWNKEIQLLTHTHANTRTRTHARIHGKIERVSAWYESGSITLLGRGQSGWRDGSLARSFKDSLLLWLAGSTEAPLAAWLPGWLTGCLAGEVPLSRASNPLQWDFTRMFFIYLFIYI